MTASISPQSLIGKNGIPTPYVEKVVLEPATRDAPGPIPGGGTMKVNGLLVTVGVVLVDIEVGGKFQWSQNERLLKYMKLRVFESRKPSLTRKLADRGFTMRNLKRAKSGLNPSRERIISIDTVPNIKRFEAFKPDRRATAYLVPYEVQFFVPNSDPDHLAYFCACFLDTNDIRSDLDANFKNKRFRDVKGYVTGELAINNGIVRTETSLFRLPSGKVWSGPVHKHSKGGVSSFMAGPDHTARKHPTLKRAAIPNFKIQDHRFIEKLLSLEYKLGREEETIDEVLAPPGGSAFASGFAAPSVPATSVTSATSPSSLYSKKQNYVSEVVISRDSDGRANLLFSLDQRRLLQKHARYGGMLNSKDNNIFKEVRKNCRILSLKVLRTKVQDGYGLELEPEEVIAYNSEAKAGQFKNKLYTRDKDGDNDKAVNMGFIKEVDLLNAEQMRTFSCTDIDMGKNTDGEFKYSVEIEIEDGTVKFVTDLLKKLKTQKQSLRKYYNVARRPNHYDAVSRKFKKRFLQLNAVKYPNLTDEEINNEPIASRQKRLNRTLADAPWNRSIVILMEVLGAVTNLSDLSGRQLEFAASSLHAMINPMTGSPDGIESMIRLYEHVESILRRSVSDIDPDPNVKTSLHKERFKKTAIFVRKDFHETFTANKLKKVYYDFLGGKKRNKGGLREVTFEFLRRRFRQENSKYFTGDLNPSPDPLLDLKQSEFAFLSPANVNYDIGSLKQISARRSLWSRERYNKASLALSSINLNPSSVGATTPLGSATLYNGEADIRNILSSNLLAMNNITIEPTAQNKSKNRTSSETFDSESILGSATSREFAKQVNTKNSIKDEKEDSDRNERRRQQQGRSLAPVNNMFVQKILNRKNKDFLDIADRKGIAAGMSGFDLEASDNIIDKLYHGRVDADVKIRNLPNQIKSLFLAGRTGVANRWLDSDTDFILNPETLEMIRYNHFILQRIEYFDGFQNTEVDGVQVTKPIFRMMDPRRIPLRRNASILCRMVTYKNNLVYAGIPEELSAPILDEYFILKIGGSSPRDEERATPRRVPATGGAPLEVSEVSPALTLQELITPTTAASMAGPTLPLAPTAGGTAGLPPTTSDSIIGTPSSAFDETRELDLSGEDVTLVVDVGPAARAEKRLAEMAGLSRIGARIMRLLLSKDRRLMSKAKRLMAIMRYMLFATSMIVKQPVDLILLGARIGTMEDPRRLRSRSSSESTTRIIGAAGPDRDVGVGGEVVTDTAPPVFGEGDPGAGPDISVPSSPPSTSSGRSLTSASGYEPPGSGGGY